MLFGPELKVEENGKQILLFNVRLRLLCIQSHVVREGSGCIQSHVGREGSGCI